MKLALCAFLVVSVTVQLGIRTSTSYAGRHDNAKRCSRRHDGGTDSAEVMGKGSPRGDDRDRLRTTGESISTHSGERCRLCRCI